MEKIAFNVDPKNAPYEHGTRDYESTALITRPPLLPASQRAWQKLTREGISRVNVGFLENEDRGSGIGDQGSRIEDQGHHAHHTTYA